MKLLSWSHFIVKIKGLGGEEVRNPEVDRERKNPTNC